MDALALLEKAGEAGLVLRLDGGQLHVRGAKHHAALVREIAKYKKEIVSELIAQQPKSHSIPGPPDAGPGTETPITPAGNEVLGPLGHNSRPSCDDTSSCGRASEPLVWGLGPSRKVVGTMFPAKPSLRPPKLIRADPVVLCSQCDTRPVLRELRRMTGGRCYDCWAVEQGARP